MQLAQITQIDNGTILRSGNLKDISSFCRLQSNWKQLLQIVQFAQITQFDNGTPTYRPEKTFLHFADCNQIENSFCKLCNLHKLHERYISSFCRLSNWKQLLQIVQFAQITQIDKGTNLQRVDLKRHFFILQIALKLKTAFANCAICTNYTNW